ncbi:MULTISPECIES: hypothetical protein [unclassified Streptomyces]|uniref:hypothetical protein n=1 Tax=unclassified Streptomyces TaxID=2593676 RepID=UPI0015E19039|nr:hypothetical protein [Streptomyces sp. SM10]
MRDDEWPPLRDLLRRIPVHGCVWVPVLLCCLWPALVLVLSYPLARSARRQAHRRFPPHLHRRILDPQVMRVQRIRTWAAVAVTLLILVVYGTAADFEDLQGQYMVRTALTPLLLLLTAPLVILMLFRFAPPAARPGMRERLRPVIRSAVWYFGAFISVPLLAGLTVSVNLSVQGYGDRSVFSPLITMVLCVPALWMSFFVFFATASVIRTLFGTSEVHAALPALLTGVLVWVLAVVSPAVSGMPPGPPFIQVCALLGGPLSVSALAWWELDRLRAIHGVTLRG